MDTKEVELHSLFEGRLNLYQYKKGYRFSIDTLLLGAFAHQRLRGSVADLGTGSGVLPILLARSPDINSLTGFEIQPELADLARRNVALHDLGQRVTIEQADIKEIRSLRQAESFDAAIANPPFYPLGTGRINPGSQDAAARHELLATISDFVSAASYLIKNGGRFCAIFPSSRSTDLIFAMRANNIEPKALRCVHSRPDEQAVMLLVEGIKNAGIQTTILPPLFIYATGQTYSPEVVSMFETL
jgi:tRNA1Val (adenine37-N6)-methyltransferase